MIFSFGQPQHERLEIDVLSYERSPVGDYWDDNWLNVEIRIQVGGFRGQAQATFQAAELKKLANDLQELHRALKGTAKFETLEDQLELEVTGDGRGHVPVKGCMLDQAGGGNRLHFEIPMDQTDLAKTIGELMTVLQVYPVRV